MALPQSFATKSPLGITKAGSFGPGFLLQEGFKAVIQQRFQLPNVEDVTEVSRGLKS